METNTAIELPAIDHERDIRPVAVVVEDYNGTPIVHVFVSGERLVRINTDDWSHEFTLCTSSDERQSYASLAYHLGELSEDDDQLLADAWGDFMGNSEVNTFDEVTSKIDGHLLCAWVDTVCAAVFDAVGEDLNLVAPTS